MNAASGAVGVTGVDGSLEVSFSILSSSCSASPFSISLSWLILAEFGIEMVQSRSTEMLFLELVLPS